MDPPAEHPYATTARFSIGKYAFSKPRSLACLSYLELLLTVFGLASKAAHKNQRAGMVSCDIGWEMHVSQLLLTPASPKAEEIN